jgi:hypothetical protein
MLLRTAEIVRKDEPALASLYLGFIAQGPASEAIPMGLMVQQAAEFDRAWKSGLLHISAAEVMVPIFMDMPDPTVPPDARTYGESAYAGALESYT